jgi:hypothetical protein
MIESGLGRTDHAEVGRLGPKARRTPEAQDRDVRKPGAPLPFVHAQALEPRGEPIGEAAGAAVLVVQDDHADAAGLAVASRGEDRPLRLARGGAELADDSRNVARRAAAEEGEREVEVLGGDDSGVTDAGERLPLPGGEALDGVVGERESEEETKALTGAHVRPRRRAEP